MTSARHQRGILDTNTVIMLPRLADATLLPGEPLITAVTLAELSVGPLVASTDT
jgi:tRNA(fMet)-specific endonuclease VapC